MAVGGGDPSLEDHVVGVELQLNELVEEQARASVQGLPERVESLQAEIDALQADLAASADRLATSGAGADADAAGDPDPLAGRTILDP